MFEEQTGEGQDVFDDSGATNEAQSNDGVGEETLQDSEAEDTVVGADDKGDEEAGTPPATKDDIEYVTDAKGQKLIPEHRFKAALKSASERAEKAEAALAERDKVVIPVPDKQSDPEGHARYVRMEASVEVMREMRPDYQEVIEHYAEMARDNPLLDQAVDAAPLPAKLAYDIAKKDLEIKEALKLKDTDEWKEFLEFKKSKAAQTTTKEETSLNKKVSEGLRAVPNLNRSTNAAPSRNIRNASSDNEDSLFSDAPLDR